MSTGVLQLPGYGPAPMPRRKSRLWKLTFWLIAAVLLAQISWLATVPLLRERLKLERAMPRVLWLTWPTEIDLQSPPAMNSLAEHAPGPEFRNPRITSRSGGGRLGSLTLEGKLCWERLPRVIEPWNIRIEMAVFAISHDRFLMTTRGAMNPEFTSKRLLWQRSDLCEPVRIHADFVLPDGSKFYGYILRLVYKGSLCFTYSQPSDLVLTVPIPVQP